MKLPCVVGSCKHQLSNEKELHFHIRELLKSISCYELIPNDERVSIGSIIKDTKQNIWFASDYGLVKLSHNYLNNACFTNTC
jgi:alpha-galactosidase